MREKRHFRVATAAAVALITTGAFIGQSLAQTRSDRQEAASELEQLRGELRAAVDRHEELTDELEQVQGRMALTELEVQKLAREMIDLEGQAVDLARDLYMGGVAGSLEGLLSAESFAEIQSRVQYLESSGQFDAEVFGRLAADRVALEEKLDDLDDAREELDAATAELADLKADISNRIATQRDRIAAIDEALAEQAAAAAAEPVPAAPASTADSDPPDLSNVNWDAIAQCESGGRWHLDSTYDGGLQFHPLTWLGYGGGQFARYAWQASREEQIIVAERVLAEQGPGAWPHCFQYG